MKTPLCLVACFLISLCACGTSNDDESTGGADGNVEALSLDSDDFVACDDVKNGKGSLHVFQIKDATKAESKQWNKKVVAIGFKGKLRDEAVGFSQGDQPDLVSAQSKGDTHTLTALKKSCPGQCDGFMTIMVGGGELGDGAPRFISVAKLTIDTHDKTVEIEGTEKNQGLSKDTAFDETFKDCKIDDGNLKDVEKQLN
jgi:hypothetical protein